MRLPGEERIGKRVKRGCRAAEAQECGRRQRDPPEKRGYDRKKTKEQHGGSPRASLIAAVGRNEQARAERKDERHEQEEHHAPKLTESDAAEQQRNAERRQDREHAVEAVQGGGKQ